jgi:hypothetical protein
MTHLSRRTKILGAAALAAAALVATGTAAAAPAPAKPAPPPATSNNLGSYTQVAGTAISLGPGGYNLAVANCPAGMVVLGGGGSNSARGTVLLTDSRPEGSTAWGAWYLNNGTTAETVSAWAICGT